MNISTKLKPEIIASDDVNRPGISACWLDAKNKRLLVTDGSMALIQPVEIEEGDIEGYIPNEAFNIARKEGKRLGIQVITADKPDAVRFLSGATLPRKIDGLDGSTQKYPDIDTIVPKADRPEVSIRLDAARILALAQAMGAQKDRKGKAWVTLHMEADVIDGKAVVVDTRPVRIEVDDSEATAILMPVRRR